MAERRELREFPRVLKAFFTAVKWYEDNGVPSLADVGRTINISEGGVLLEVSEAVPFLSMLSLHLGFDSEILRVDGEVRHIRVIGEKRIEIGIKFLNLSDEGRAMIKQALQNGGGSASEDK